MDPNNRTKLPGGLSPAALLILGVVLTAAIILGIKFLMGNDSEGAPPSAAKDAIFRDETDHTNAPGYNPAVLPENPGGDSLSMFKKTNAGYAADESSATDKEEQAGPKTAKKTAAVKKQAAKTPQKSRQRTVIPRMQGAKPFGSATPARQGLPGGAGMPDISDIMKQAQQKPQSGD
ncbi:MAG: hypothetical protein A2081_02340 [Elusimicrobia bacterium GWC2_61_19]|nr:MAG: hypothetical protein A2081_02340 [Elusimicrobia bacterium GWC2_61_19]